MNKIIGIDLGTTNSAAAVMQGGRPTIIPAAEGTTIGGGKAFPSIVAFTRQGELLVGEPARRQRQLNPAGTIVGVKRKMGTDYKYYISDKEYTPQQISSFILQKIKTDAEHFLGETIERAVITVPAYFNNNQRQATKDAAAIAGLKVDVIRSEPTAAALAYGFDKNQMDLRIMVFDLGGGTLDVTILRKEGRTFRVECTTGDTQLGGGDIDKTLADYLIDEFKRQTGVDVRNDTTAILRIIEAAEQAKIELSSTNITEINLPFLVHDPTPKALSLSITRTQLEQLVTPFIERCKIPIIQALQDANLTPEKIDKIVLIGGPTRMPIIRKIVSEMVGKESEQIVDQMDAVAMGAAIEGSTLSGDHYYSVEDVVPLTLGIEVKGGLVDPIIERNTTYPVRRTKPFYNPSDVEKNVVIHVVQGERLMASDCTSLGKFTISDIPHHRDERPQIEVTFNVDADGIINVIAKDLATYQEATTTISGATKLTQEEIERMIKQAEEFARVDKEKKEAIELISKGDNLTRASKRLWNKWWKPKLADEIKKSSDELKIAIDTNDIVAIKTKMNQLTDTMLSSYYENSYAIIIGISKYQEESRLPNAYNDALGMQRVLKEKYGFNVLKSLYNEEATGDNIREIFEDLLRREELIRPKDRVLVYYSGHGKLRVSYTPRGEELKEGYIVPCDSRINKYATNIGMKTMIEGCQKCVAKHVLLVLDCCYSGYAALKDAPQKRHTKVSENYVSQIASKRAIQVLAAGQEDEPVSDSGVRPGYSAFTGSLLDILETELDLDGDGILTAAEIGHNLEKQIIRREGVNQKPAYNPISGSEGGDFIFRLFDITE